MSMEWYHTAMGHTVLLITTDTYVHTHTHTHTPHSPYSARPLPTSWRSEGTDQHATFLEWQTPPWGLAGQHRSGQTAGGRRKESGMQQVSAANNY